MTTTVVPLVIVRLSLSVLILGLVASVGLGSGQSAPRHRGAVDLASAGKRAEVFLSTYVGSDVDLDQITSVRSDRRGNVYVTGNGSPAGIQSTVVNTIGPGQGNPWIAKLDPSGTPVMLSFLGGSGRDWIWDIDVDDSDNLYVIGETESLDFPTAHIPEPSIPLGGGNLFVAKLAPGGSQLLYTAVLGIYSISVRPCIAVTPDGAACFGAGADDDNSVPFVNAIDSSIIFGRDVLVGRIDAAGDRFDYITALGGDPIENVSDIAVDRDGCVYVVGNTNFGADWPTVNPPMDVPSSTTRKGFIAKLSADGSHLVYSSLLGGHPGAGAGAIAVNEEGQAFVGGFGANVARVTFPITTFLDTQNSNDEFSYVLKIPAEGGRVLWATAIVGDNRTEIHRLALDNVGAIYAVGPSQTTNLPLVAAFQREIGRIPGAGLSSDLMIAKLSPSGTVLKLCTYYGGSLDEDVGRVAVNALGDVYVGGWTQSTDLPLTNAWESYPGDPPNASNAMLLAFRTDAAPAVVSIKTVEAPGKPLRIVIRGTGLDPGIQVYIGDRAGAWPGVRGTGVKAVLKGEGLAELFPPGQAVSLRIVNSAGAAVFATFVR